MRILAVVVLLALVVPARADSWTTPQERRLASPNGKWEAVITPSKDGSGARASIGAKGKPGTPFTMETLWMPVDAVLFDDGSVLALDGWHRLGHGKVAVVHDRDGSVRWSKTLAELIGKDLLGKVQVSVSSIWWRKTPLEWKLAADREHVLVTLIDENQLVIALATGDTQITEVTDVGDDPKRLFNRARTLSRTPGRELAALPLLERALAKTPDLAEALLLAVAVLQQANQHGKAVELVERVSARWKTMEGYNVANVCIAWAKSYAALARPNDAERVLRRGIAAAPLYINPAIALAELLTAQKRGKDADAAIDAFVARLLAEPNLDTFGLTDAAAYFQERKEPRKALALYLEAYKRDEVTNQFLYANLAKLYEAIGNDAEAIRIDEQLRAYFQTMGSAFDIYLREIESELARLRAKQPPPKRTPK